MQIEMIRGSRSKQNTTNKKPRIIVDSVQITSTNLVRLNEPEQVRLFDYHSYQSLELIMIK
jgi:hypothetical protein